MPIATSCTGRLHVVVTGANSGVGFGIASRFLAQMSLAAHNGTRPEDSLPQVTPKPLPSFSSSDSLPATDNSLPELHYDPSVGITLILACRSKQRALAARTLLLQQLDVLFDARGGATERDIAFLEGLEVVWEPLDLSEMKSVYAFTERVKQSYPYITHLYLNAGVGAWAGINWMAAFIEVFCEPMKALTDPEFKKQHTGWRSDKDKLGWVWQCNVFGHWCLARALTPHLLASPVPSPRIVWTSSMLSSGVPVIDLDDVQCLTTDKSYERSKRQTDVLSAWLDRDLQRQSTSADPVEGPRSLVCDPAVTATEIFRPQLGFLLYQLMMAAFYFVRFVLNSQNHPITLLSGCIAFLHVGLLPSSLLPSPAATASSSSTEKEKAPTPVPTSSLRRAWKFRSQADRWGRPYVGAVQFEWDEREADALVETIEELRSYWEKTVTEEREVEKST